MSDSDMVEAVTDISYNISETTMESQKAVAWISLFHKDQPIGWWFYESLKFAYYTENFAMKKSPESPKTRCSIKKKKKPSVYIYTLECKMYATDYVTGSIVYLFPKVSRRKSQ